VARFAFVVPPLVGHTNPTISVGRALAARGHQVAWVGHAEVIGPLVPEGATLLALATDDALAQRLTALQRSHTARSFESLKILWEDFLIPLAQGSWRGVEEALRSFAPDVVICDQQALAGFIAARRLGLRWATFATTSAALTNALAALPKVKAWADGLLASLQQEAGVSVAASELSPELVVVFSTEALAGPLSNFPPQCRFVGPSIQARIEATPFPFEELLPDRRKVLVSLGTISAGRGDGFFDAAVSAFADDLSVQLVLAVSPATLHAPPPAAARMILRERIPQLKLLPHLDAVVTHGGHNTVCEALAHGLPLVVTPIRDDQSIVAQQVVQAGCGVRVRYGRLQPQALHEAVHKVLEEPQYREAAARVKASFAAAGGAQRAATLLEELAA
jgi:MGT family glycosyltransferase